MSVFFSQKTLTKGEVLKHKSLCPYKLPNSLIIKHNSYV